MGEKGSVCRATASYNITNYKIKDTWRKKIIQNRINEVRGDSPSGEASIHAERILMSHPFKAKKHFGGKRAMMALN